MLDPSTTMPLLAIDTSNGPCSVALFVQPGKPPIIREQSLRNQQASSLIPMIEAALEEAEIHYADLQQLAVTTGPGSFSGLRIGIAAAKGLALALQRPLLGITSFDAYAFCAQETIAAPEIMMCLDASRGEYYHCLYHLDTMIAGEARLETGDILAALQASHPIPLYGNGVTKLAQESLPADFPPSLLHQATPSPLALWTGQSALHRLAHPTSATEAVRPFYIRMADAKLPRAVLR